MQISIDASEYNETVQKIKKAQDASLANQDNFSIGFGKCDSITTTNYSDTIDKLRECLTSYNSQLNVDISKLNKICKEVQALDTSLAK